MTSTINTTSLILLSFALGLGSCKNEKKLEKTAITFESTAANDAKLAKKANETTTAEYIYEYDSIDEELGQDENNYKVHGTDEDGNKVFGSVNIEGEIGIGMISGTEAKGIEIVAERISQNQLIATDVKGYEYKLQVEPNQ